MLFRSDSSIVTAGNATVSAPDNSNLSAIRVDMVFRVLPGPGNYQIAAGRAMAPGGLPSGVLLQVRLRNPLADPGLFGIAPSAALGAVLSLWLGAAGVRTVGGSSRRRKMRSLLAMAAWTFPGQTW